MLKFSIRNLWTCKTWALTWDTCSLLSSHLRNSDTQKSRPWRMTQSDARGQTQVTFFGICNKIVNSNQILLALIVHRSSFLSYISTSQWQKISLLAFISDFHLHVDKIFDCLGNKWPHNAVFIEFQFLFLFVYIPPSRKSVVYLLK